MRGNLSDNVQMIPSYPKLAAAALIQASLILPLCAWGAPSAIQGQLSRLKQLRLGESAHLSIRTPDGMQALVLHRHQPRRSPELTVDNIVQEDISSLEQPTLFQGRLRTRRGQIARSKLSGVAADLYRNQLRIRFYGRRSTRFYTVAANLEDFNQARISHLPASFPLACAQESAAGSSSLPNVGSMARISAGRSRRVMELALDGDYEYYQDNGSSLATTNAEMLSIVNVLDGIYSDQLSISVSLVAQNVFTSVSQPYVTSSAEDLRDSFAAYRNSNPFGVSVDASHLLTGKIMYVPGFGTGIVGISYLSIYDDYSDPGTVCRFNNQYSYTVVERVNSSTTYSAILTAHEIGHNLSLFHTDSGIMNPAPEPSETNFSASSLSSALAYIDEFGTCLASVGPTITLNSSRVRSGKFSSSFTPGNYSGENCTLKMYGSENRYDLPEDARRHSAAKLLISKAVSSNAEKKFEGSVGTSTSRSKRKVYFIGELSCDGEIASTSEIRNISTNVSSFLTKLKTALKKKSSKRRHS